MFSVDLDNTSSHPMVLRPTRNVQQQQQQSQASQQVFGSQYGYAQQAQHQPATAPYFTAYPEADTSNGAKGAMNFMPAHQTYMQSQPPPQQVFGSQYGYTQHQQSPAAAGVRYMGGFPRYQGANHNDVNAHVRNSFPERRRGRYGERGRGRGGYPYVNTSFAASRLPIHNSFYYNKDHYFGNTAVSEKTPTVRIIDPVTNKTLCVKMNRVYMTKVDLTQQLQSYENGDSGSPTTTRTLSLCIDFLTPQGCALGGNCNRVHIAGMQYTWEPICPTTHKAENGEEVYDSGFEIQCYSPTMSRYYKFPSKLLLVSAGSEDYIAMHNEHGDNFKTKFKLCLNVEGFGKCDRGKDCPDIHCSQGGLETVRQNSVVTTHINDPTQMQHVPRLRDDIVVRVFDQNSFDYYNDYPGSVVLITEGAKSYHRHYVQEMNNIPSRRCMQHCAHFRLKNVCRLGESCRFLHVLPSDDESMWTWIKDRAVKERREVA